MSAPAGGSRTGTGAVPLALGSGAARGFAHIGVLRALEGAGPTPATLVGTSMGALVGAFAAGGALDRFEAWVRGLDPLRVLWLLDIRPGGGRGTAAGPGDFDVA